MLAEIIHSESRSGNAVVAGDITLIPMSKFIRLQLPGLPGGLIWNRPVAVVARRASGEEQVLPIRDVTRQAQLALLGVGLVVGLLLWRAGRRNLIRK